MSNLVVTEPKCMSTLRLLDPFIDDQLDAGATAAVRQHLNGCASCSKELELRRHLRKRLKAAVSIDTAPSYLQTRILANVRYQDHSRGWSAWRPQFAGVAAVVALCLGTVIAYQLGHLRFTAQTQENYISAISQRVLPIIRVGLGDHVHCAVYRKYPQNPPPASKMVDDLGAQYQGILDIVKPYVPEGFRIMMAHRCRYHGRQFVHVAMKSGQKTVSLVLASRQPGETFQNSNLKQALQGGLPIYESGVQSYQIAGFETRDHLAYVVSDMPGNGNTELMLALAPKLQEYLARMES
jgi:hypothetical protein